jgi:Zn-dependent protease
VIAAAGSAAGLLFGGAVWVVSGRFGPYSPLTTFTLENLVFVNVFWGLLNWLPIRPLDGGHLLESLLQKVAPKRGPMVARTIFTTTAVVALVLALQTRRLFIAVLAGWLLVSELGAGRQPAAVRGLPTLSYGDDTEDEPEETPL